MADKTFIQVVGISPAVQSWRPRGRTPNGRGPELVRAARLNKPKKEKKTAGEDIVARRHDDWKEHQLRWRFLLDSYEGGQRYRNAQYGLDRRGLLVRNLIRHKREMPDPSEFPNVNVGYSSFASGAAGIEQTVGIGPIPGMTGADPVATAADDTYEYRRARTPVPPFVGDGISTHLAKVYQQQIRREGPEELTAWWQDVDGAGASMADWMRQDFAPPFLTCGSLDVCLDRPALPADMELETKADEAEYGQDRVVAAIILPENMVHYRTDPAGNYTECLVREYSTPDDPLPEEEDGPHDREFGEFSGRSVHSERYRHWTETTVALYKHDGEEVEPPRPHGYDFVPIVRCIDLRRSRTPHVGKSRYEEVAEIQREYYNRDSELILNDTLHSSPHLSGPRTYCKPDAVLSVGADLVLPIPDGQSEPQVKWEYVTPPSNPSDLIRRNMQDLEERKDRILGLTKPAGVTGTTGGTVSQSGFSKMFDAERGNDILTDIAKSLARAERRISEMALMVRRRQRLAPGDPDRGAIKIIYPSRFQLKSAESILDQLSKLIPAVAMEAQLVEMTAGAASPPATPKGSDESQAGGNPSGPVAATPSDGKTGAPAPAAPMGVPATDFAPSRIIPFPTLVGGYIRNLAHADFEGENPEFFAQNDADIKAYLRLHKLPELGQAATGEVQAGPGSQEQVAGQDPTGISGATMVSGMVASTN